MGGRGGKVDVSAQEVEIARKGRIVRVILSLWMSAFLSFLELKSLNFSFLNDVDRIAVEDYEPSDDDIVRARLRTMGVQEYRFMFERGLSICHF